MVNAYDRLVRARTDLVTYHPMFGGALRLELRADASQPTGWTDGRYLGYNPGWVEGLTSGQVLGFVIHETLHVFLGHPWRRGMRDQLKFNIAADAIINPTVKETGVDLPPNGVWYDWAVGKSAEWVYDRLPQGQGGEFSPFGEVRDADGGDPTAPTEAEWQQAAAIGAAVARAMGKLPASLERLINEIKRPKVNWLAYTHQWAQRLTQEDWSYRQPNRRWATYDIYLPSLATTRMRELVVVIDTSRSVDGPMLELFGGGLVGVMEQCRPSRTHVLYADAEVHRVDTFEPYDRLTLNAVGGGGTDFQPAFRWLKSLDDEPAGVIYLTDGCGTYPQEAPEVPVLWAVTGDVVPPFGDVVRLD